MRSSGSDSKKMKNKSHMRDARLSSSSSSTNMPATSSVSVVIDAGTTAYLHTPLSHILVPGNATVEEILDRNGSSSIIPSAGALNSMLQNVKSRIFSPARLRGEACDRGMRELAKRRKERMAREPERERDRGDEDAAQKLKLKKLKDRKGAEEERPPAVGAHGVARQDGVGTRTGMIVSY